MKQEGRTILAFLTASIVPAVLLATFYPLSGERDWQSVLGTFFVVYYFVAAATGFLGLPAFLVLRKFELITWWSTLCSGALVGAIAQLVITSGSASNALSLLSFAMLGAIAGLAFWLVLRPRSQLSNHGDKDAA